MQSVVFPNKVLPYLLLAPQIVLTVVFFFWPASQALYQSVLREDPFGLKSAFVGFANFRAILDAPDGPRLSASHRTETCSQVAGDWVTGAQWFEAQSKKTRQNYRRGRKARLAAYGRCAIRGIAGWRTCFPPGSRSCSTRRSTRRRHGRRCTKCCATSRAISCSIISALAKTG